MNAATVFADLETGGTRANHPDIQIGAVVIFRWQEIATFERKIQFNPKDCSTEALALNHYDPETWESEAVPEEEALEAFCSFLREHASLTKFGKTSGKPYSVARIAGHNARTFEGPRLMAMAKRHDCFLPADGYRPLDTLQLALWHFVGRPDEPPDYKLPTLASVFGIETPDKHSALADARTAARVAYKILNTGRPIGG